MKGIEAMGDGTMTRGLPVDILNGLTDQVLWLSVGLLVLALL